MQIADEEYFRSCVARERQLARLLGHHNIEECYESAGTLWENTRMLPKWTRDWDAAGSLLSRFHISLAFENRHVGTDISHVRAGPVLVRLSDHPTDERAVMSAIVKAVIFQLEHKKH